MTKKNNFIPSIIRGLSYLGCFSIISNTYYEHELYGSINPIIHIDNLILRCFVLTIILTYAGFRLIKYIVVFSKFKLNSIDKWLSTIFFYLGIYSLFFPISIEHIMKLFIVSGLLHVAYLANLRILKSK